jgi:hypothetical protein
MLLEQTHVYEQIYVFLLSDCNFCDSFFPNRVYVYFDLNIFE